LDTPIARAAPARHSSTCAILRTLVVTLGGGTCRHSRARATLRDGSHARCRWWVTRGCRRDHCSAPAALPAGRASTRTARAPTGGRRSRCGGPRKSAWPAPVFRYSRARTGLRPARFCSRRRSRAEAHPTARWQRQCRGRTRRRWRRRSAFRPGGARIAAADACGISSGGFTGDTVGDRHSYTCTAHRGIERCQLVGALVVAARAACAQPTGTHRHTR
jgi:hypothetical protein